MQDGFVLRGADGTITEVNHAFCSTIGLDGSEIVGSRPPHVWWPEEMNDTFADLYTRYLSGVSSEDDLIYQRRNGEHFPVLVTNAPPRDSDERIIAYIGTVKDMAERVRAEEQIRFQAALIDQVEAGVVATDANGTIVFWNSGAETLYGWQHQEVIGKPAQEFLLGSNAEETVAELVQTLNSGRPWEGELTVPRRDGKPVPVLISSAAVHDRSGRPAGIAGVVVDMTDRKRAEARMAAQYAVARALSDALTLSDGLRGTLQAIAVNLDWQYGGFWIVDDRSGLARCSETWHADGVNGAAFDAICLSMQFERGGGLPGISAAAQTRMFERYFRGTSSSRSASESLGLGLYVAHGIVLAHGGRMWVESEDGNGTTFAFSLPLAPREAAQPDQLGIEAVDG